MVERIDGVSGMNNVSNSSEMSVKIIEIVNNMIEMLKEDYKNNNGFSENGYKLLIAYLEYTSGVMREFIGVMDKMYMSDGVRERLLKDVYNNAKNIECMIDFME